MKHPSSSPCGSRTDIGRVRSHNEDSLAVQAPLYAVADGMGGHEAGEVASEIAIEALIAQSPEHADASALGRAVKAANRAVIRAATNGTGRPGMGTTMTAAIVEGSRIVIAQVGDSRSYLVHNGILQRITRDHSLMADMIEQGRLTEAEARYHPNRSVITRALGSDPDMFADLYEITASAGDRLLLCSDGLSGMLEDSQLLEILTSVADPQHCADTLVNEANAAGGHDNITVIVVDVLGDAEIVSRRKNRRALIAVFAWIVALAIVVGGAWFGLNAYAKNSAYIINEGGYVTVYRGLPGSMAGIHLSWLEEKTDIPVSALPASTAARLTDGISVGSLDEAEALLETYREDAESSESTDTVTTEDTTGSETTGSVTTTSTNGTD